MREEGREGGRKGGRLNGEIENNNNGTLRYKQ